MTVSAAYLKNLARIFPAINGKNRISSHYKVQLIPGVFAAENSSGPNV